MNVKTVCLVCIAVTVLSAKAGPLRPEHVDADAKWVLHYDAQNFQKGLLGQAVLQALDSEPLSNKVAALKLLLNFTPQKDLAGVTLYGPDNMPEHSATLVYGTFDVERLKVLIRAGNVVRDLTHGKHTILAWNKPDDGRQDDTGDAPPPRRRQGGPSVVCFHPAGVAVLGSRIETVEKCLDVIDNISANLAAHREGLGVPLPAGPMPLWATANLGQMAQVKPRTAIVRQAKNITLSIGEDAGRVAGRLEILTATPETAAQVQLVVSGLLAAAQLAKEEKPDLAKLAQAVTVSVEELAVTVKLDLPASDAIAMLSNSLSRAVTGERHHHHEPAGDGRGTGWRGVDR